MTEGANRIFLRENPLIEKELLTRLKRGDTTIELAEYLKTTKYPGSTVPASVSAFIQKTYPIENMQYALDAGYTQAEIERMHPNARVGLKKRIRTYRDLLLPHLKKYDGTIESLVVEDTQGKNKNIANALKNFRNEKDPKLLKLIEKELGNPEFKSKIARNQLNKLVETGGSSDIRVDRSITSNWLREKNKPVNVALNWIGDNASKLKYGKAGGLELLIKDYETKFGKLGKDPIFTRGAEGDNIRTSLNYVNKINPFSKKGASEIFSYKKGFSEEEIFKAALAQNNKSVQKRLIDAFTLASENRSYYADLGVPALLEDLGKNKTNILGEFKIADDIKMGSSQEYGGVGSGVLRRSLIALNITPKQLSDYQFIRKPLRTLNEIINSLSRKDADGSYIRDKYGLTSRDAKFVQQNFQKIEAGRKSLNSWLKESEKILGKNLFKQTLGPINFEHNIAKSLGAAYKYLPRDYLLRGQYAPESFNLAKRDVFDKPLIHLMNKFSQTGEGEQKIKNLIRDFNKATNNYAGDLVFEDGKLKMLSEKADLTKYIDPKKMTSVKEYLKASQLGPQLKEFAPTSKSGSIEKLVSGGKQVGQQLFSIFNKMSVGDQGVIAEALNCPLPGRADGGRIGYALGTRTINCVQTKLATETEIPKLTQLDDSSPGLTRMKTAATGFLQSPLLKKGGKFGALAAVGAAGAGLVKTFMNDDPTTYLSDENQQKNMLIEMVTGPMVDQPDSTPEILDWQLPTLGATTAAGTAVTAPSTIEAARSARFGKKPSGYTKTALKTLGRGLAASGTPLGLAALEPLHIAGQVQAGDSLGEIATNPWNYAGLAFADDLSKFATKGLSPGIAKAMRLGISPAALRVGSRFLGMPGLALSLGISGYEMYDDYKKKRGWFSEE
jgi:hypothetical protein